MEKIAKWGSKLLIEIGSVYNYKGVEYKVATSTSKVLDDFADTLTTTEWIYHLEDTDTGEVISIAEDKLQEELPKYNEVVAN